MVVYPGGLREEQSVVSFKFYSYLTSTSSVVPQSEPQQCCLYPESFLGISQLSNPTDAYLPISIRKFDRNLPFTRSGRDWKRYFT